MRDYVMEPAVHIAKWKKSVWKWLHLVCCQLHDILEKVKLWGQ